MQKGRFDGAATTKAKALGAAVVQDKTNGPAGTAVTIADPGGALVALWVPFASQGRKARPNPGRSRPKSPIWRATKEGQP